MAKNYDELLEIIYESKMSDKVNDSKEKITKKIKEVKDTYNEKMVPIRLSQFKRRYKYDEEKKEISVNGITYKVDLDIDSPTVTIKAPNGKVVTTLRQVSTNPNVDDPVIIFDKEFFLIMGKSAREAIMQHEIGHIKMHGIVNDNKHADKAFVSEYVIDDMVENTFGDCSDSFKRHIKRMLMTDPEIKRYLKSGTGEISPEERKRIREIMKKYVSDNGGHSNPSELEADRYAANKTSNRALGSGLDQINELYEKRLREEAKNDMDKYRVKYDKLPGIIKKLGKMLKLDPDQVEKDYNNAIEEWKKQNAEETKLRHEALKDKELRKAEMYKR